MSQDRDAVEELRARAEARLQRDAEPLDDARPGARDIHELRVHQLELQLQNEELRRVRAELEESRDRYAALFDRAPVGLLTVDLAGRIEAANAAAAELLEQDPGSLTGRSLSLTVVGAWGRVVRSHLQAARTAPGECRVRRGRRDGSEAVLRLQSRAHGDTLWVVLTDVTREVRGEAELIAERDFAGQLLDIAPSIVLVLDVEGRIGRYSRFLGTLTGYELGEVRGADWFETFVPAPHRAAARERFAEALRGSPSRGHVCPIVTRDGQERTVEWHDAPIVGAAGQRDGVLAIGRDISEVERLEERARRTQKMEAVGTLAVGVAHDFNNLLMGLIGMMDLAQRRLPEGHDARELMDKIKARAQSGAGTVSQLLAFSRPSVSEPGEQPLDASVAGVEQMLRLMLDEDVELDVQLAASGARIRAGKGQIEQILTNLVVNARQAMPEGGRLTIRTSLLRVEPGTAEAELTAGPHARLEVRDTGHGMDDATRARVFEPFFTTKGPGEGTGLGLSTVYAIVKHASGRIDVESAPGAGTRIRLDFPILSAVAPHPSPAADPEVASETRRAPTGTILLVEDEELVRAGVRDYLERGGYRVLEAADAADAVAAFGEHGPEIDLLLTDVVLPGVAGGDLARSLTLRRPDLRVVFMSAHPAPLLVRQGRVPEDAALLQKPFAELDLLQAVAAARGRGPSAV